MDPDDATSRSRDPLAALATQDLAPFSVEELEHRMRALEAEMARTAARIDIAVKHRATADAIFRS